MSAQLGSPTSPDEMRDIELKAAFLSDTLVIAALHPTADHPWTYGAMLQEVCERACAAIAAGARAEVPIAYRGALAFGDAEIHETFMIGPAVDECAECMEQAEAAVVWFAPSALQVMEADMPLRAPNLTFRHPVPLKGGGIYDTYVLNVFFGPHSMTSTDSDIDLKIAETFTASPLSVAVKKQNTQGYLAACRSVSGFPPRPESEHGGVAPRVGVP